MWLNSITSSRVGNTITPTSYAITAHHITIAMQHCEAFCRASRILDPVDKFSPTNFAVLHVFHSAQNPFQSSFPEVHSVRFHFTLLDQLVRKRHPLLHPFVVVRL